MTIFVGQEKPSLEDLAHHGVKGMKWGVRKDRSSSPGSTKIGSNDAAPVIALGAFYASMVIAASLKVTQDSGRFHQMKTKNTAWKKDGSLTKKMTVEDLHTKVVSPINSNYGAKGTRMNCRRCTLAYEMRRRGMDVKATTSSFATGQTLEGMNKATAYSHGKHESIWGNKQISSPGVMSRSSGQDNAKAIFNALSVHPEGARGELGVAWRFGGGHSMAWEVVKGKPVIFDTQNGKTYRDANSLSTFASTFGDAAHTRLDNVALDEHFLRKWATNNG